MAKLPFTFLVVTADWGRELPAGDYTVGRNADPRATKDRDKEPMAWRSSESSDKSNSDLQIDAVPSTVIPIK